MTDALLLILVAAVAGWVLATYVSGALAAIVVLVLVVAAVFRLFGRV